jgi:hypothetical protein
MLGVAIAALVPAFLAQTIGLNATAARFAGTTLWQFIREALLPNLVVLAVVCAIGHVALSSVPQTGWGSILLSFAIVSAMHVALSVLFVIDRTHLRAAVSAAARGVSARRLRSRQSSTPRP